MASRRLLPLHCCRFGHPQTRKRSTQHATCHTQHATCNTPHATCSTHSQISKGAAPVSAAALPQVACRRVGLPVHVCRWEWSACDERSSRLIIVVYSPRAAPARSCKQRYATVATAGLGDDFAMRMPRGTGAMGDPSRSPHRCSASNVAPTWLSSPPQENVAAVAARCLLVAIESVPGRVEGAPDGARRRPAGRAADVRSPAERDRRCNAML